MCNPRKLAQDVILSRATSAAAAAVDVGRNYNSTHQVGVVDKAAAVFSISSFYLHPEARDVVLPVCWMSALPFAASLPVPLACAVPAVRPSVRLRICLFDTRHAYAIFVAVIAIYFVSPAAAASAAVIV